MTVAVPASFPSSPVRPLVLGSTSRYRRELLTRLRQPFEVASPDVDESAWPGENPRDLACRLALAKARAVAARFPNAVVIGSDQVADLAGQALGKPGTHERAAAQLRDGDGLLLEDGSLVRVTGKAEALVEITAASTHDLARIAWRVW